MIYYNGINYRKNFNTMDLHMEEDGSEWDFEDVWFIEILNELADFGIRNTDRAMAFGLCLLHNLDNFKRRIVKTEEKKKDIGFVYYKLNSQGIPIKTIKDGLQ